MVLWTKLTSCWPSPYTKKCLHFKKCVSWLGIRGDNQYSSHIVLLNTKPDPGNAAHTSLYSSGFLRRLLFLLASPGSLLGSQISRISPDLWQFFTLYPLLVTTTCFWHCTLWSLLYCRTSSSSVRDRQRNGGEKEYLNKFQMLWKEELLFRL